MVQVWLKSKLADRVKLSEGAKGLDNRNIGKGYYKGWALGFQSLPHCNFFEI